MEKQNQEYVYMHDILQFSVHTQASILEKKGWYVISVYP